MAVRIADSLAYRIHRSARMLRKHFLDLGAKNDLDLTPEQWFILNKLHFADGGLSQVELGDSIFADRPNMTRMLQSMEKAGYVRREVDPEDGRRTLVSFTPQGRRAHDAFAALVPAARARLFAGITKEEMRIVERVLSRLEANLEKEIG